MYVAQISGKNGISLFHLPDWLNGICEEDVDIALSAAEMLVERAMDGDLEIRISKNFTTLLTFLFREAEEREETDNGKMLQRVIVLQDSLLERGVRDIENWLQEAERP